METQKIVFIGAGNVATKLGEAFKNIGFEIVQVYSKTIESASELAEKLNATAINDLTKIVQNADLYIVSINDDHISEIAAKINLKDKLIVHTSGSVDMKALKNASTNYGVLYPLQTFSKSKKISFNTIPLCIEANTHKNEEIIENIARQLSANVHLINSEKRKTLHLAAVFACNFTNHMYAIAEKILKKDNIPFEILYPLILETADKVKKESPGKMQTGPAIRGDKKTLENHLDSIKSKRLRKVYKLISKSIQKLKN